MQQNKIGNVFKFGFIIFDMAEVKKAFEILEESTGKKPNSIHKLTYDSATETLEPIYFFILELLDDFGIQVEKLIDNFVSSPGSAHFGEMGQRASVMQQQGSKLLGDINTVLRSIITVVYDLRDFKIRLQAYEDLHSDNAETRAGARLSLKQIWMDKVDIQKGNSGIKAMAMGQGGFVTLIDAFLMINDESEVENLDLNDVVKRILKPRIAEFNHWIKYSESELRKRFAIEQSYLKSQVSSLHTYVAWAKPYLKAAEDLRMMEAGRNPALVKMFNTLLLEMTLFGKREFNLNWADDFGHNIPRSLKFSSDRKYYEIILIDFEFVGIPQRTQQGYSSGGKTIMTFRGYALNGEEVKKFMDDFEKNEMNEGLRLIEGITTESLGALSEDIEFFLNDNVEERKEEEEKRNRPSDTSNPFLALIGAYNKKPEMKKVESKKDNSEIKMNSRDIRLEKEYILPALKASNTQTVDTVFEIYKKAHGMMAFPN